MRMRIPPLRVWVVLLPMIAVAALPAPARAQQPGDAFAEAACMVDLPQGIEEGRDVTCGYLTVPLRHAEPEGATIELAVMVLESQAPSPAPDPLFMMQGGPGGSTIDLYSQLLLLSQSQQLAELRRSRDVVLFDQRGTLHSRPTLTCRELFELTEQTIEQRLSVEEGIRLSLDATARCRERLASEGVDLAAFNSLENAADVEALRVALGYDTINLYGVSYGTLLAQHVMREHPEGLRSVILDAVVPAATNPNVELAETANRSFGELFAACAADAGCNAAYPNLEQTFFQTIDALNAEPARVPLTDPETGNRYDAVVDGELFYGLAFQLLYATEILPALPRVIVDASQGNFDFLARVAMPLIIFDRTLAIGMYNSTTCAEDADYRPGDIDTAGVRPKIAEQATRSATFVLDSCRLWGVPTLALEVDAPVTSDIPTLLLSGRFDPVTPAPFADEVARGLSRSYRFTFLDAGHGALTAGECSAGIALAFLNDPTAEPDGTCVAQTTAPRFVSPATVLPTEAPSRALAAFDEGNRWQLLALGLLVALLLSPLLIWPLAALARRLSGGAGRQRRRGGGLARLLALLAGVAALVFVIGLAGVVAVGVFGNDLSFFFGVPRAAAWLLWLPPASLALAIGMLLCTVGLWNRQLWSAAGRIYYTLLTLAAFGYVALLVSWDAFAAIA